MKFLRKINLEINKDLYNPIQAKQNDTARYLLFNLLDNGVPFSLENKTVRVYGLKPDGTKVFNNLTIINAARGLAELQLTTQMLVKPGCLKLELVIYEATDILSTTKFDIDVIASLRDDAAIESTNEFSALTLGLSKLDEWDKYFKETSGAIEEKYTERLSGLATSLEERVKYYNNVAEMKADETLKEGQCIKTLGYYYPNDSGECEYIYQTQEFKPIVKNYITPEMFGAVGDGITDDTEAIQKAFDSDLSNIVVFSRKTYLVTSQLNINKSKLIRGAGYSYTPSRSTILKCTRDCIKINVSYVKIAFIYLQGNKDNQPSYEYLAITVKDVLSKAIAQITLEDIFVAYFDEGCKVNGYSWNYNNVNINNVNRGFNILGGTAHRFNACSVNLCKTGFETTDVIYSTLLNCSVDHTTERAYYIHGASRNISLLGCSGENISKTLLDIDSAFYVNVENLQSLFNNTTSGETLIKLTSSSYCKLSQINLTGYNSIQGNILMINLGGNNIIENCEWLSFIEKIKIIQSTVLGRNDIRLPINTSIESGEFAIESDNKIYCENVLPLLQNSESKKSIGIKLTGLNSAMPLESKLENINGFNNIRIWASSSTKEQNIYDIKSTGVTVSGNGSTIKFQNMIFKSLSELPTNGFSISDSKVIFINCDFSQLSVSGGKKITCANFANVVFNGCQGITISSDVKKDGTCDVSEKNA